MKIPNGLRDAIKNDNLVVFIGAGLSINIGLPNWNDLVCEILNALDIDDDVRKVLFDCLEKNVLTPLDVLDKLQRYKNDILLTLDKKLNINDDIDLTIQSKIQSISGKIITTNFDKALERSINHPYVITPNSNFRVAQISNKNDFIFKIHGDIEDSDKCLLFSEQYKSFYFNDSSALNELKSFFVHRNILFIGFSMNDPYIKELFNYMRDLYSDFGTKHYLITTDNKTEYEHIEMIHVNDYCHDFDTLLDELISIKQRNSIEVAPDSVEQSADQEQTLSFDLAEDYPILIEHWVGRGEELKNLDLENFKVIFITGIGGQGKSALAAKFLQNKVDDYSYENCIWVDFKEERHTLKTKLIAVINKMSGNIIPELMEKDTQALIDTFISKMKLKRYLFIFDNIDEYIDLEELVPVKGIDTLLNKILSKQHSSKFIFTCRPFIKIAETGFYQITLLGLSIFNVKELISKSKINIPQNEIDNFAEKIFSLTKGHPLWISLIIGQARSGIDRAETFMKDAEEITAFDEKDFAGVLSEKLFSVLWNSLKEEHQTLLRTLAELVKPEKKEDIQQILKGDLTGNRFHKGLNKIISLHLVEQRSKVMNTEERYLDLHPLVKKFIRSNYSKGDRRIYISKIICLYDKCILFFKDNSSLELKLDDFKNWTAKAELYINAEHYNNAFDCLEEICGSMEKAGYIEEYLRVAAKLFNRISWDYKTIDEYANFISQFDFFVQSLIQYGNSELAENIINNFASVIPGKSSDYINMLSQKVYLYWYKGDVIRAIEYGEEGEYLLSTSNIEDKHNLFHNLALARRDSGNADYVQKALQFFLRGNKVETLLLKETEKKYDGSFFGNISRCFQFKGDIVTAIKLCKISLRRIIESKSTNWLINAGYACNWLAEMLYEDAKYEDALKLSLYSTSCWKKVAPCMNYKNDELIKKMRPLCKNAEEIINLHEWKIEKSVKLIVSLK